ncbi:sortase domain-bontaining protein [Streptomyces sp. NPDC060048]|uniref:sortase domain-containing protein n=1 Tax=unclassified Streptomyces TaxID=2593676 RepID=UPI0036852C11
MTKHPFSASRTVPKALAGAALALLLTAPAVAAPVDQDPVSPQAVAGIQEAALSIPAIGVSDLAVIPYQGSPDDAAGTRIQDRGVAASPYGPRGGVGPGDVGNYIVTAHRISAGGPLWSLPSLKTGASVTVTADGVRYEYLITATRTTSFRSQASMDAQRAAVPGSPGTAPTRAMITVSTCLTPEDNAAGNLWRDPQNNPEHRLDKIGVLTSTNPDP